MPQLPTASFRSTAPGPSQIGQATAEGQGAAVGRGLRELGTTLNEVSTAYGEIYAKSRGKQAASTAVRSLQEFKERLQNGRVDPETGQIEPPPPPEQHEQLYREEVARLRQQARSELSGAAAGHFDNDFGSSATNMEFEVRKSAIGLYKNQIQALNDDLFDKYANAMVSTESDIEKADIQAKVVNQIADLQAQGVYTPQEALARTRRFTEQVAVGDFRKMLRIDPLAAAEALESGEFKDLPADMKERFITMAYDQETRNMAREEAERNRQERKLREQEKMIQEETAKQAAKLVSEGTLTPAWVNENRHNLSKEDYTKYLLRSSGMGDVATNPNVYANLRLSAAMGINVTQGATEAYKNGTIAQAEYDRLMTEVRGNSAGGALGNNYTYGRSMILQGRESLADIKDPGEAIRTVKALDAWSQWNVENPKATSAEAREEWTRLVNELKIIDRSQLVISMIRPKFSGLGKNEVPTNEQLDQTWERTKKAYRERKIGRSEARREKALILEWRKFVVDPEPVGGQ